MLIETTKKNQPELIFWILERQILATANQIHREILDYASIFEKIITIRALELALAEIQFFASSSTKQSAKVISNVQLTNAIKVKWSTGFNVHVS